MNGTNTTTQDFRETEAIEIGVGILGAVCSFVVIAIILYERTQIANVTGSSCTLRFAAACFPLNMSRPP